MADKSKVTKKVIDEISENFSKLTENEAVSVGHKLGNDAELVKQVRANPKSKQAIEFYKNLIEKTKPAVKEAGSLVNAAQALFDQVTGRAPRMDEAAYAASKAAAEKVGGGRPPAFEPSEAKYVGPGGRKTVPKPMPKHVNYTLGPLSVGEKGGPLVPRVLNRVRDGLVESEVIYDPVTKAPMSSETALVPMFGREEGVDFEELADLASKAKPGKPGKGISEITPDAKTKRAEGYRTEAERAVDSGIDADVTSQARAAVKPAATALAAGAITVGGFEAGRRGTAALMDRPLAEQPESGQVTQAAEFEKPEDLGTATDMAVDSGAIAPEQAEQIKANVEKVKTVKDLIKEIKEENKREKTRLEWLRAIETIAHGLATAIGANALMNRGSPFAVDFSKGPQVDWESQFNRLQKDFDTQINAILKDEELQQKQKQFEAREARRVQERAEDVEFRERRLAAEQAAGEQKAAAAEQAKQEKLSKEAQAQYKKSMAYYGDLSRAVEDKKPGAVLDALANLGADEETTTKVREAMDRGIWDKILNIAGIKESPTPQEAIQELRPKSPSLRGAEEMVTVSVNGNLGQIPKSRLEEFKKQYPNAEVK